MVEVNSVIEQTINIEPHKKQRDFLKVPWSVFEGLYGGSAGSGKTDILIKMGLIYGFHEHPLYTGLTLRRTFPELESEIIERSRNIYPSFGAVYNESKKVWRFPSGAREKFGHAHKEEDIRGYDSDEYNLVRFDEATHFTKFQYMYLSMSRVRSKSADLPAIVRSGTNPGNVGHSFFKERFVKPNKNGYVILEDNATGLKRIFIPARITDNPDFLAKNPHYIKQLESLPEAEKRAKLLGDWDTYEGQVFNEWRLEPLSDEPSIAKHVIAPFDLPLWWPRLIAIDWGFKAYTVIYWAAVSPDGRLFIYREYAQKETLTDDWLAELVNLSSIEKDSIVGAKICHSANQHRGEQFTIYDKLQKAFKQNGFKCIPGLGEKNRLNGKLAVHELLRWKKSESIKKYYSEQFNQAKAQQIFRLYGQEAYNQYVNIYIEPEEEKNIPKLQVFDNCTLLIDTIPNCLYEEQKEGDKAPEDVAEFDGDDPYDTLRILANGYNEYIIDRAKEFGKVQEIQTAINAASKGDQTAFYRKMEAMEAKERTEKPFSVRRTSFRRSFRTSRFRN